jgi:hypothetical protein
MVKKAGMLADAPAKAAAGKATPDPNVRAAEDKLRRHFGTKVRIVQAAGGLTGKIELEFYNKDDLGRLYDLLIPRAF